jgi:cell division protein FtsZ
MGRQTIIGVGCAGNRIVNRIVDTGRMDSEFAAINTDRQELESCKASFKLLIGERETGGLGGMPPAFVEKAAEESATLIAGLCAGKASVIIVAGLGAGTGTGAAPVVARIAKEQGCQVVAVVTRPFRFEGLFRRLRDATGLVRLADHVDRLVTVPLGDILPVLGRSISLRHAFDMGATVAAKAVELLPSLDTTPGPENSEVVDVRAMLALVHRATEQSGANTY